MAVLNICHNKKLCNFNFKFFFHNFELSLNYSDFSQFSMLNHFYRFPLGCNQELGAGHFP